jgi:hypothetical protein
METLLNNYGWWLLALVLIGVEVIAPGYFMLWIGIAAGVMGLITFALPAMSALAQAIVFAALAIASCTIYWRFVRPLAEQRNDQPLLNRRGERMVGRRVLVVEPIVNGRGKVKVGDGAWLAEGPDLPAGSEVEVTACEGTTLKVRVVG